MTVNIPTETKVKVAGAFSFLTSTVVLGALGVISGSELVANLPDWLSAVVGGAITAGVTFFTAYQAKHTPRPDLGES